MKVLTGTPTEPGIPGYFPEVSAALYITNGDITDHAYKRYGTLAYTVEANPGSGPGQYGEQRQRVLPGQLLYRDWECATSSKKSTRTATSRWTWRARRSDPGHPDRP